MRGFHGGRESGRGGEEEEVAGRLKKRLELLVDGDMLDMAKTAAWRVSFSKPGNGVVSLGDDSLDTRHLLAVSALTICHPPLAISRSSLKIRS